MDNKTVTLHEIGLKYNVNKLFHENILRYYEEYMPKTCKRLLEIGCLYLQSAKMFKEWYGDATEYNLLDIFSEVNEADANSQGFFTFKGSQDDISLLAKLPIDINMVSEDASHHSDQQITTFKYVFKEKLASGGLYVIEDCYGHFEDYWRRNIIKNPEDTIFPLMQKFIKGGDITSQMFTKEESDYFRNNISRVELKDNCHCFIWKK